MAEEVNKYRIYCTTEAGYVCMWGTEEPTTCPNDTGHTIDTNSITIVQTISTDVVLVDEHTEGYFETEHIEMSIPSGTPGDVTEHDVVWPMDIILWKTLLTPTSDMINDQLSAVASPETTVGVIGSAVNIGDTVLTVNSTVLDNTLRGFLITLDDGVNKDVLGRCIAKDDVNSTITVDTATSYAYAIGTPVKISVYIIKDLFITDTNIIEIGGKGLKGKSVPAGLILRVYYTNNSGTAKAYRWRTEIYNIG